MFLRGRKLPRRKNVYEVDGYYIPPAESSSKRWAWDSNEFYSALRWAAKDNLEIVGFTHSHPHGHMYAGICNQSIKDGQLQAELKFDLSIVVGVWPKGDELHWWLSCWLNNHAFPMLPYIHTKKGAKYLETFCFKPEVSPWTEAWWQAECNH
jgi:proteasome lid subunit RPN8/RPN11